jgi:hypothetical protein
MEVQDPVVQMERRDCPEMAEWSGLLGWMEPMGRVDLWETMGSVDLRDLLERMEFQVSRAGPKVRAVVRARLVRQARPTAKPPRCSRCRRD